MSDNFKYLNNVKPEHIADFILNEHPQTITLILSHLSNSQASDILNYFPDDLKGEIVMRIANIGDIQPSIIKRVSDVLASNLEALSSHKVEIGGTSKVAGILSEMGSKGHVSTLAYVEQVDEYLACEIRGGIKQSLWARILNFLKGLK